MAGTDPVAIIDDSVSERKHTETRSQTIELAFNVFDEQVLFHVDVAPQMIKLSDLVPFARELSSKISNIILERVRQQGLSVPCRKGCSACCSYLVPLSIPEAFRLREEILAMPEDPRKGILESFLDAAKRILKEKPDKANLLNINNLSDWYSGLELACPFLSDNVCTIYDKRPIACREYLVTGTELYCGPNSQDVSQKAELPFSVLECLGKLSAELEQRDIEAIIMPLALPWTQENLDRNEKMRPALEIIERLIESTNEEAERLCRTSVR